MKESQALKFTVEIDAGIHGFRTMAGPAGRNFAFDVQPDWELFKAM